MASCMYPDCDNGCLYGSAYCVEHEELIDGYYEPATAA